MKDDSEMHEGNWFYIIASIGPLIIWAIIILVIDRVIDFVLRR
jgi:hypothetical protein